MPRSPALHKKIDEAKRHALIEWLQANPRTSVDALVKLRKEFGEVLGKMTIGELQGAVASRGPRTAPRARRATGSVSDRNQKVLSHLEDAADWVAPADIIAATGIGSVPLRRSLRALEAEGKARRKGRARATKWRAA